MLALRLRAIVGLLLCGVDAGCNGVNGFSETPPSSSCARFACSRALKISLSLAVRVKIFLSSCDLLRRRDSSANSVLCLPELDVDEEDAD